MELCLVNNVPWRWALIYLLEWPKSGVLTASDAGEDVQPQEIAFLAVGHAK